MARKKQPDTTPPPPKHYGDVKHGCCSCEHYKLEAKAFPCRDCENWNYWEDAAPDSPHFPFISQRNTSELSNNLPETEFVPDLPAESPKKAGRRPRKTVVMMDETASSPKQPATEVKKKGGRPKKTDSTAAQAPIPSSPSAPLPRRKPGRPRKTEHESTQQKIISEPDQIRFSLD